MILFFILKTYFNDVKEIGKDKLAVPLSERLAYYLALIGIPTVALIIWIIYHCIY